MTHDQILILLIILATVALFLWGRLRHDVVAVTALMACVVAGLVPAATAFAGFGHPAVITVACVLVLSRALLSSGAVDVLTRNVLPKGAGRVPSLAALMGLGALLSSFMNNVGAMALLMPVAVQLAGRLQMTTGRILMPLAFGTILGGMTTLVGTPPNLIVSGFRAQSGLGPFGMFDFTPVGLSVAALGVGFVVLVGWRLVPARSSGSGDSFETGTYLTEARVTKDAKAVGMTLHQIEMAIDEAGAQVAGLIRNEVRMTAPRGGRIVRPGDILVLEAHVGALPDALTELGLRLEEQKPPDAEDESAPAATEASQGTTEAPGTKAVADAKGPRNETEDADIVLRELVVRPGAAIVGRSATDLMIRTRYGVNLLAVSRDGRRSQARLRSLKLRSGDLLLIQGAADVVAAFATETGCIPLAERELRIPDKRQAILSVAIMSGAIAAVTAGLLPAAAAFMLAVLASVILRTIPARAIYSAIDWPVVVLLAALLPVAGAMEQSGAAALLAGLLVDSVARGHPVVALALVLLVTMFLSDVMNNAATAAVMCPIATGIAASLGVSPNSFLMAVAIGASCAFLTPIGHQNNTLILGPGGFRFGDYWQLGLPLEIIVVAVSIPLLLVVWPL